MSLGRGSICAKPGNRCCCRLTGLFTGWLESVRRRTVKATRGRDLRRIRLTQLSNLHLRAEIGRA
jgi:hypothetical protein